MMTKRRWLAPIVSTLFGLLLLIAVEVLLRLAWSPPMLPSEQLVAVQIDPFEVSKGVARTKSAYLDTMRAATFAVPKPDGTFRIFCIGGSTTLGYPYPVDVAWPASLERRLAKLLPGRNVEVINVGATSYGSARTLGVLRGLLKYQPDLVIVATGDAEFVEDSFRESVARPTPAVTWLHELYLSRALKVVLPESELPVTSINAEDSSVAGFLFSPVLVGPVYQVTPDRRSVVMDALRKNLAAMLSAANRENVPLMFATLPANIASWPPDPDRSIPAAPGLRDRWQQHIDRAEQAASAGQVSDAVEGYLAAASVWSDNATFCFNAGRYLVAAGLADEGALLLQRAVDLDSTPVRATTEVNALIRSMAEQGRALLADPVRDFESLAPYGLPGEDLVLDYAHPTPRGHIEIARTVLRGLTSLGQEWQFSNENESRVHRAELNRLVDNEPVVDAQLSFVLGQIFERKGLLDKAAAMYQQAVEQDYQGPFATFNLVRIRVSQGSSAGALDALLNLAKQYPGWTEPYILIGYLYEQRGEDEAAVSWYQKAMAAGDQGLNLYGTVARLLFKQGKTAQSRAVLDRALAVYPDDCSLAALKGRTLESGISIEQVRSYYRNVLSGAPDCQQAWENLGVYLMDRNRWQDAEQVFLEALNSPEALNQHHLNLGYVYLEGLDDPARAKPQFEAFLQRQPGQGHLVPGEFGGTKGQEDFGSEGGRP